MDVLYWHTVRGPGLGGVIREGDYKLIVGRKPKLFNLKDDLSETTDLAASQPERVQSMLARWKEWNKGNAPDLWGPPEKPYQYADYEWLKGSQALQSHARNKSGKKRLKNRRRRNWWMCRRGAQWFDCGLWSRSGGAANRLKHDVTRRGKVRYENVKDPHLVLFSALTG